MLSNTYTILVADDELFFRKLFKDLLEEEGHTTVVCESGEEVIDYARQNPVDLILTDMVMPGCSGLDVLQATRSLASPPDVILVTGHASLESAIEALKNGARDYLVKPFNPEELKHIVRGCLDQRKLLTENDQFRRQIRLFQAGQSISSLIDLDRLVPQALEVFIRETNATSGCAYILNEGVSPKISDARNMSADRAEQLVSLLLADMDTESGLHRPDKQYAQALSDFELQSAQVRLLALSDGGVVKGGLVLCDVAEAARSEFDLQYLCDQVQLGFENACRYQSAQELMYTDDLTGLYNHRYMQVALGQEIRRSQRYGHKFSLLFLDLDRFKTINDNYGHLAGSTALQEVGQLLRDCVRDVDTLFRFGGDEFAAILVEADEVTARIVAERIRKVIEGYAFLESKGMSSHVTVTAGYATFPTDATDKQQLLELADQAMYAGKNSRNVICSVQDIRS